MTMLLVEPFTSLNCLPRKAGKRHKWVDDIGEALLADSTRSRLADLGRAREAQRIVKLLNERPSHSCGIRLTCFQE